MFTDVEGSTSLARALGTAWGDVLDRHQRVVRTALAEHGGVEVDTEGDAFFVVFDDAPQAVECADQIHRDLAAEGWPNDLAIRVRVGVHTGSVEQRDQRWVGLDVHKAARIGAAANGGQTIISAATRELLRPEHSVLDLGEHRLKDFPVAVRLYQLGGAGIRFPPPRSLDGHVVLLPTVWSEVVGRGQEIEAVQALWASGRRLVTLAGPAGVGKTSLALALAQDRADRGGHSAVMVHLAGVTEPGEVIPALARTVEATSATPPDIATMIGKRPCLVVFDNFEQVRAAGPSVLTLLEQIPQVSALVTSQAPLHVAGEHVVPIGSLPSPLSDGYEDVATSPAAMVFASRVSAADPRFVLTDENAAVVAEICRRLDGNPLALELAAARCRAMTPRQLLARLDDALTLLRTRTNLDERHASLQTALEWTLGLLSADARALVDGFGVFEGGWTLELAEQVAAAALGTDGLDVAWAVDDLIDLFIVRRSADDPSRLVWPAVLRDLARRRLASVSEREDRWRRAHAAAMLALGTSIADADADDDEDDGDALRAEEANVLRALDWSADHDASLHSRLASVCEPISRSHRLQLQAHLHRAVEPADDPVTCARLQTLAGLLAHRAGDPLSAIARFGNADAWWQRTDRTVDRAAVLVERAYTLASYDSEDHRADRWLDEADVLLAEANVTMIRAVFMRAYVMVIRRDAAGARSVLERLRALHLDEEGTTAVDHAHLSADCELISGDYEAARQTYSKAFRLALDQGNLPQCSVEAQGIAMALGGLQHYAEALQTLGAAERLRDDIDYHAHYTWWTRLQDDLVRTPGTEALDETGYEAAWQSGHRLSLDQAVAHALHLDS
jgi:tetratricopeptide (TPR) repeat protein